MLKLGMIIGVLATLIGYDSEPILTFSGFCMLVFSAIYWWIDREPEHVTWYGGKSKLPWAQDMSDIDKKTSEFLAQRKIEEWKSSRRR